MSWSDISSNPPERRVNPKAINPVDNSSSVEPESISSSTKVQRRIVNKRWKNKIKEERKYCISTATTTSTTSTSTTTTSTSSSFDYSSLTYDDYIGSIPRSTYYKEHPTQPQQQQLPRKYQQRKDAWNQPAPRSTPPSESTSSSSSSFFPHDIFLKFGETEHILHTPEEEDREQRREEDLQQRNYEKWLDVADLCLIPGVFQEPDNAPRVVHPDQETEEKSWDEKDEEELTAALRQRMSANASASGTGHQHLKKKSPAKPKELPLGGGVIRKAPGRRQRSVDDPEPQSSSESPGTTSYSLSSSDQIQRTNRNSSNIHNAPRQQRGQSFVGVRTVRLLADGSQQRRDTPALAGVYSVDSVGLQERNVQERTEEPTIELFEDIEDRDDERQKSQNEKFKPATDKNKK